MYKVYFENQIFASVPTIENACSLALAVHSSSNVPHHIEVFKEDHSSVICFDLFIEPKKDS